MHASNAHNDATPIVIRTEFGVKRAALTLKNAHGTRLNASTAAAFQALSHMTFGCLDVRLADGRVFSFIGNENDNVRAELILHNEHAFRRFFTGGNLGFCEGYLDGEWSSPNLADLLTVLSYNSEAMAEQALGKPWMRLLTRWQHKHHANSRLGAKQNITAHYDLGNTFYAQWLDPGMTYSSAMFLSDKQGLNEAQQSKYASLCRRLMIEPHHRVLEIGCGWGGFAEYVAREIGARVTAITISPAQFAYTNNRINLAGLGDRVDVQLIDYRDVAGQFDRIASIEMIEAVGQEYWGAFFKSIERSLTPGGRAEIQAITIRDDLFADYARTPDFIQMYVFPGGMLPSPEQLHKHIGEAGLVDLGHINFGPDYARTLHMWLQNFQAAWPRIQKLGFDERFHRIWEMYLSYCMAGFRAGTIDVLQKSIVKPNDA